MSAQPWVKWFAGDFLNGVVDLDPFELSAYVVILNLIYDAGVPIQLDEARLARRLHMRVNVLRRAIDGLIEHGKLELQDGFLMNERARKVLRERAERSVKAARAATTRWNDTPEKPIENSVHVHANAMRKHEPSNAIPEARSQKPDTSGAKAPSVPAAPRATRLPPDWMPSERDRTFAQAEGLTSQETDRAADRFRDYWRARGGREASKLDWSASWRNWVRRDSDDRRDRSASVAGRARAGGRGQGVVDFASIIAGRERHD